MKALIEGFNVCLFLCMVACIPEYIKHPLLIFPIVLMQNLNRELIM